MTRDNILRMAWEAGMPPVEITTEFIAVAAREKVAAWMRSKSYVTGHGDTTEDLLKELEWQVAEREREACAKVCEKMADNIYSNSHEDSQPMPHAVAKFCAAAIRARGET